MKKLPAGFASPLILVVIGLIVGIGITFAYFQFKSKPAPQPEPATIQTTSQSSPVSKVSPTASADETASWKTYTNKEQGFEVKYPNDLEVILRDGRYILFSKSGPTQEEGTGFHDGIWLQIKTANLNGQNFETAVKNLYDQRIREWSLSPPPPTLSKPLTEILFNSKTAFTYTVIGAGILEHIFVASDKIYAEIVNSTADPTNQGYQNTATKILSTRS